MNSNINISKEEYDDLILKNTKKSPLLKDIFFAFIIGGLICVLGQFIQNMAISRGIDKEITSSIGSISLIFIGALLTSLNLYSKLGSFAGAGSTIPITGFSNSIVSPAIEYKSEGYILGLGANMFKVAGPVLVYGITTSVLLGFVYYVTHFLI